MRRRLARMQAERRIGAMGVHGVQGDERASTGIVRRDDDGSTLASQLHQRTSQIFTTGAIQGETYAFGHAGR